MMFLNKACALHGWHKPRIVTSRNLVFACSLETALVVVAFFKFQDITFIKYQEIF